MMNSGIPVLYVSAQSIKTDPALAPGMRGARKLVVTETRPDKEAPATCALWHPPALDARCEVLLMQDTEIAHFTESAAQDRHYHEVGTEIYMVLEGIMAIEIDGTDYSLSRGDMVIVGPGTPHFVRPSRDPFLCRVITVHCRGADDKYVV